MEILKLKYEAANKAISSLKKAIATMEIQPDPNMVLPFYDAEENYKMRRDSLIHRFEFSVDALWKYCKEFLFEDRGIKHDSPKSVFRACHSAGLITAPEAEILIEMIDDRNLTTHTYKEDLAERIAKKIPVYCNLMKKLLESTK